MSEERARITNDTTGHQAAKSGRFLGSLKDALVAASRDDTTQRGKTAQNAPTRIEIKPDETTQKMVAPAPEATHKVTQPATPGGGMSAAEAARQVKAAQKPQDRHVETDAPPTTRVVRDTAKTQDGPARTQLVRGKVQVERGDFNQDPVVGWLVIVGGPEIGAYRPIFEGNNTIGRNASQRIPIDFGDESISSEEQAYIRYDSTTRSFLFVPNLTKTNVVSINDKRPTGAVEISQMDVITMGRTQLVFVPFCGSEFDWAELSDTKG